MPRIKSTSSLGPLPKSDRNRELQELSLRALRQILPISQFLVRDERIDDAGVDASLELLIDGHFTNMRAQIQLKGTDKTKINADDTISLSVETSNVNYLLNGPSPLYILYIAPRNELRYTWARDERKRLDHENPKWMQQKYVALRFKNMLTITSLQQIYERIRKETQLNRHIHEVLGRSSTTEQITISINAETLHATDPGEINELLLRSGMTFISSGYAAEIRDLLDITNPRYAKAPRMQLIRGYAEYTLSQYQSAFATLSRTMLQRDTLSIEDRQTLIYLRNACEFQLGRISRVEFSKRIARLADQSEGVFALSIRLEQLRVTILDTENASQYDTLLAELRSFVNEIVSQTDIGDTFKLQARLVLLYAEGQKRTRESWKKMHQLKMRRMMGYDANLPRIFQEELQEWMKWQKTLERVVDDAYTQKHPLLLGEAFVIWIKVHTARLMNSRFLADMAMLSTQAQEDFDMLRDMAEKTINIYGQGDYLEYELRAKMILADVYMLFEQSDKANTLAQEVLPQAQAMDYGSLVSWATEFLSGASIWDKVKAVFDRIANADEDFNLAQHSDDEMKEFARDGLQSLELPIERLAVFERECFSLRDIARERVHWCQHIELIQDLRHTVSPITMYRTDPNRSAWCQKYNYKSRISSTNWQSVISAFKQTYCSNCPNRKPKQQEI